ncbi:carbohydrate ABC transporter permease [Kineococcus aurantiacus]|uniref:Raffinose/stachyose/melibiose transport system permease protein n=1 Tax=Kineococcus aurantiacus TaxID=37633 RepID=A0A7Y9J1J7_9ACTN|nr:carbohydrate ABC transporter permease [Kineococcus aurantiacus]NYD23227.1 raffinose/stachyose/melibiose transport system permease protein [Kineococcus aurantiacus]
MTATGTRYLARVCLWGLLLSLAVVVVYPLLWMVLNGFKTNAELFANPFALPHQWGLGNFAAAWDRGVSSYLATSVFVTIVSTLSTALLSAWAAYGLTRLRVPLEGPLTAVVLAGLMLAPTVALIPLVQLFQRLGLYNSVWALVILYTAFRIPFTTFLIRAYMVEIPREIDEAASIDGAGPGYTFWRIVLPLCKPIMASVVILHVLFAWNEYLFAMIFTSGAGTQTLPVGLTNLMARHGTDYPVVFAGMAIAALPMVLLFFGGQRWFIRGLADGVGK